MIALTREISRSIAACELTHVPREPIDLARAMRQHEAYCGLLRALGCEVITLAADPTQPDCVFVEDTAVVLDDLAVITRPGAESRRGETEAVAAVLQQYRPLAHIEAPATLDGGDVLVLGDRLFVGISKRTNLAAIDQLRRLTGREVVAVAIDGCLHLKSAVTALGDETLLMNRAWIDERPFRGYEILEVAPEEPFAANVLRVNETLVCAAAFPRTRSRIEQLGFRVERIAADELAKAEGGLTCCSLLVPR